MPRKTRLGVPCAVHGRDRTTRGCQHLKHQTNDNKNEKEGWMSIMHRRNQRPPVVPQHIRGTITPQRQQQHPLGSPLNPGDSYAPFIVSYPGGNKNEIQPFLDNVQGCNSTSGCEGNWKATALVKEIIRTQYNPQ